MIGSVCEDRCETCALSHSIEVCDPKFRRFVVGRSIYVVPASPKYLQDWGGLQGTGGDSRGQVTERQVDSFRVVESEVMHHHRVRVHG